MQVFRDLCSLSLVRKKCVCVCVPFVAFLSLLARHMTWKAFSACEPYRNPEIIPLWNCTLIAKMMVWLPKLDLAVSISTCSFCTVGTRKKNLHFLEFNSTVSIYTGPMNALQQEKDEAVDLYPLQFWCWTYLFEYTYIQVWIAFHLEQAVT